MMQRLLDPRNGPTYDTPGPSRALRWLAIASTPRSGSTLLARMLSETGEVGHPKEYLNPINIRDWQVRSTSGPQRMIHELRRGPIARVSPVITWSANQKIAYLHMIAAHRSSPNGWTTLKMHAHHHRSFFGHTDWRPPFRWIRIHRQDCLGQALSWSRARQTGSWAAHTPARLPPIYRRRSIDRALERIQSEEAYWDTILADESPLVVSYEELVADPTRTINRLLSWLGLPPKASIDVPLKLQADETTDRWRARYLEHRKPTP